MKKFYVAIAGGGIYYVYVVIYAESEDNAIKAASDLYKGTVLFVQQEEPKE
jgi:hypothetical protein